MTCLSSHKTRAADYVIVGAGTAGAVLARRLTDDGVTSVILIEAGSDERPESIRNPALWRTLVGSEFDWGFRTGPQHGLEGRTLPYPRGKVLGGSSSINAVMHTRALKSNFDAWVEAGATKWSYERLTPFMERNEDAGSGNGGISVAPAASASEFTVAIKRAMESDERMLDVGMYDLAIRDGERFSAVEGYLDNDVRARSNLTVVTATTVRRLLFDGTACVGVEAGPPSETTMIRANREVILSAGAIGSPQLLMVSGIGNMEHLTELHIPTVVHSPGVGQGLQDHAQGGITFSADMKGAPSLGGRLSALVFSDETRSEPDLQIVLVGAPYFAAGLPGPEHGFTVGVGLMKPDSRGSVRLASSDIDVPPFIDPNLLGAASDVARMVAGIRIARSLIAGSDLEQWDVAEVLPGKDVTTNEVLAAYARKSTGTYYHPIGTCRLGSDSTSVVDEELRVRGVTGLRVIDASVMPSLTSQNINPTVYAIAEAAAALLLTEAQ